MREKSLPIKIIKYFLKKKIIEGFKEIKKKAQDLIQMKNT